VKIVRPPPGRDASADLSGERFIRDDSGKGDIAARREWRLNREGEHFREKRKRSGMPGREASRMFGVLLF
jgi:hypothetical protein